MSVSIHVPVHSCSNGSETRGKAGRCDIWALALVFTVQAVHAKYRQGKGYRSNRTETQIYMFHKFSSNNTKYNPEIVISAAKWINKKDPVVLIDSQVLVISNPVFSVAPEKLQWIKTSPAT